MEIEFLQLSGKNYPKGIKKAVIDALKENGAPQTSFVSVVLAGKKELGDHPVLTYVNQDIKKPFVFPPDGKHYLGEVIVDAEANSQKEIIDLARHGTLHLLGIHH